MKRLWIGIISFGWLLLAAPAFAGNETITNFKSVSSLDSSDTLHVHEKISVDFGGTAHHGIYRDIPVIRRDGDTAYYYTMILTSASDESDLSSSGDYNRIILGSPNSTISGAHDYTIDYTLSPVALSAADHDRVIMNVTGEKWEYPILRAQYELTLPSPSLSSVCYAGKAGSSEKNCSISTAGNTITAISNQTLEPGSGLTVDVNMPKNSFAAYLTGRNEPVGNRNGFKLAFAGVGLLFELPFLLLFFIIISVIIYVIRASIIESGKKKQQTVVPQYEAPDSLTPAEIGMLSDNQAAVPELTATLIDLAIRGYLKIDLIQAKTWYRAANYRFTLLNPDKSGLSHYENLALQIIFPDNISPMTLSEITRRNATKGSALISEMNKVVQADLQSKGYYNESTKKFFMLPPRLSDQGLQEWAKVEGFKLYLKVAEKDRLNFSDAPAKTPEIFNKLLPYAVALGVEKEWAKQFEGIDLSQASSWYGGDSAAIGSAAYASAFAGSFADGFSSSMSSGFSGSSGGGSVGGGGGGGGGGGW